MTDPLRLVAEQRPRVLSGGGSGAPGKDGATGRPLPTFRFPPYIVGSDLTWNKMHEPGQYLLPGDFDPDDAPAPADEVSDPSQPPVANSYAWVMDVVSGSSLARSPSLADDADFPAGVFMEFEGVRWFQEFVVQRAYRVRMQPWAWALNEAEDEFVPTPFPAAEPMEPLGFWRTGTLFLKHRPDGAFLSEPEVSVWSDWQAM